LELRVWSPFFLDKILDITPAYLLLREREEMCTSRNYEPELKSEGDGVTHVHAKNLSSTLGFADGFRVLRVIDFVAEQCVKERLAGGFLAAAMRFYRYKDSINLGQLFWIVEAHDPAAIGFVVHVKNAQVQR